MKRAALVTILIFLSASISAYSLSLTVKDTGGVVRSEQELPSDATSGSVQFSLKDSQSNPADGAEVLLKNEVTGEVLTGTSSAGNVVFDSVPAGSWIVSTTTHGVTFFDIVIAPVIMAGDLGAAGLTTGVVAVGGVGAVAATAIAISQNNSSSDPMSPSS